MKIAILAGETSGDNYGALLAESIKKRAPDVFIFGTGGERMSRNLDLLLAGPPYGKMGFSSVLKNIFRFYRAFKRIKKEVEKQSPDFVVLIDNPGFNLKIAQALGTKIPCFYYIPPKIWAHHYGRIKTIKKCIKGVIPIFPFEEEIYRKEGVLCKWFGHPAVDLLQQSPAGVKEKHENGGNVPVIGLLPGSRQEEVGNLLPVFARIVKELSGQTAFDVLLSASDAAIRREEEAILEKCGADFRIIEGLPHDIIEKASLLLAASGTVNLEVALMKKPLLVFYKTSALNYLLAKIMVKLEFISPVNLLSGKKVVPEYIQRFPYDRIIKECEEILYKGNIYKEQMECFDSIEKQTGQGKVSEKVAEFLLKQGV